MDRARQAELIEHLLVEVTMQRLVTRAIIGHMLANSRKPIAQIVADLEEAVEKTSPDVVPLPDVDPQLQEKASALARARMAALLDNIGALVARPRSRMKRSAAA